MMLSRCCGLCCTFNSSSKFCLRRHWLHHRTSVLISGYWRGLLPPRRKTSPTPFSTAALTPVSGRTYQPAPRYLGIPVMSLQPKLTANLAVLDCVCEQRDVCWPRAQLKPVADMVMHVLLKSVWLHGLAPWLYIYIGTTVWLRNMGTMHYTGFTMARKGSPWRTLKILPLQCPYMSCRRDSVTVQRCSISSSVHLLDYPAVPSVSSSPGLTQNKQRW